MRLGTGILKIKYIMYVSNQSVGLKNLPTEPEPATIPGWKFHTYILAMPQLDKKAVKAGLAYHAPALSISINAGRVFWDIAFRLNKMGSSVNAC